MLRSRLFAVLSFSILAPLVAPLALQAQGGDWAPPSREMPMMPRASELDGDWLSSRAAWFRGVESVSGVAASGLRATGDGRGGANAPAQMVRFTNGPLPVVVWSDRNGDGRCDMMEIFRSGGIIIQLIDADFDGAANVVRVYDTEGKLLRQNPV